MALVSTLAHSNLATNKALKSSKLFPRLYHGILINPTIFVQYGWELCMEVMLVGATRGVMMAVDQMSTKKGGNGGRIINSASIAGISVTKI